MSVATRLLTPADVPALVELLRANRQFMAPWEPLRADEYFTVEHQDTVTSTLLTEHEAGLVVPHVILADGELVGRITLNTVVRGPFQSAKVGYWVAEPANGRGVASAAVAAMVELAFGELALHRLEAGTLRHNIGSQRVLQRNGFVQFGLAPRYLQIAGEYQDHVLFQRLADG